MQEVSGVLGTEGGGFPVRQANKPTERPGDTCLCTRLCAISKIMCANVVFGPHLAALLWQNVRVPAGRIRVRGKAKIISYICSSIQLFLWLSFCLVFRKAFHPCPNPCVNTPAPPTAHTHTHIRTKLLTYASTSPP